MNSTLKTSVCILGSGPAGIVLGNILQQKGIDCIIADKHNRQEIYERGRAGTLESTTIELLKQYNLAAQIIAKGQTHGCCEFRYPDYSVVFDYGKLCDGDLHYIYPQSDFNDNLIQNYQEQNGTLLFHHQGTSISQTSSGVVVNLLDQNHQLITVEADFLVGCDGYHGITRKSVSDQAVSIHHKRYPYQWLAILAEAPPSAPRIIYALHPDGFAGHMLRNEKITRYYLQIPLEDTVENWSDARIWEHLQRRLAQQDSVLTKGKIREKRVMSLRSYVIEPLRYERILLAGDAAHIITPMGGKGLNLAVQDAGVLAETLSNYYQAEHELDYLDRYSQIRLPYIWRAQEFSYSMLNMVHAPQGEDLEDIKFRHKLSQSKLAQLTTSATFARDFARNYVGIT